MVIMHVTIFCEDDKAEMIAKHIQKIEPMKLGHVKSIWVEKKIV